MLNRCRRLLVLCCYNCGYCTSHVGIYRCTERYGITINKDRMSLQFQLRLEFHYQVLYLLLF